MDQVPTILVDPLRERPDTLRTHPPQSVRPRTGIFWAKKYALCASSPRSDVFAGRLHDHDSISPLFPTLSRYISCTLCDGYNPVLISTIPYL